MEYALRKCSATFIVDLLSAMVKPGPYAMGKKSRNRISFSIS